MRDPLLLLFVFFSLAYIGNTLDCIQCDMTGKWYSEEEHERQVEMCQFGRIDPTPCSNRSHTHCIVAWFRSGLESERTVTERRCGVQEDVTGCTLYNAKLNRRVRHLLNNKEESRRETQPAFVEVCSESCPYGDCINHSPTLLPVICLFIPFLFT